MVASWLLPVHSVAGQEHAARAWQEDGAGPKLQESGKIFLMIVALAAMQRNFLSSMIYHAPAFTEFYVFVQANYRLLACDNVCRL